MPTIRDGLGRASTGLMRVRYADASADDLARTPFLGDLRQEGVDPGTLKLIAEKAVEGIRAIDAVTINNLRTNVPYTKFSADIDLVEFTRACPIPQTGEPISKLLDQHDCWWDIALQLWAEVAAVGRTMAGLGEDMARAAAQLRILAVDPDQGDAEARARALALAETFERFGPATKNSQRFFVEASQGWPETIAPLRRLNQKFREHVLEFDQTVEELSAFELSDADEAKIAALTSDLQTLVNEFRLQAAIRPIDMAVFSVKAAREFGAELAKVRTSITDFVPFAEETLTRWGDTIDLMNTLGVTSLPGRFLEGLERFVGTAGRLLIVVGAGLALWWVGKNFVFRDAFEREVRRGQARSIRRARKQQERHERRYDRRFR